MAHRIPVGTEMLLDYVCLHAKKKAIPMAHRMLNNIETSLAKQVRALVRRQSPWHMSRKHLFEAQKRRQPPWHIA